VIPCLVCAHIMLNWPATAHCKTIFRLALSNKCVQALLRFRIECQTLPWDVGSRSDMPRSQRFCPLGPGMLDYRLIYDTLCLSVRACCTFVIGDPERWDNMQGQ